MLAYIGVSSVSYVAYRYSQVGTKVSLQRAVRLEPSNAEYWWRLGRAEFYVQSDSAAAQKDYDKALSLNSFNPHYWLDYANALLNQNRESEGQAAIQQAIRLDPNTPRTNWEAGNMYLASGNTVAAFHQFRDVLMREASPTYPVLPLCWRVSKDADLMVREAVPPRSDRLFEFLGVVLADKNTNAAAIVWKALTDLKQDFDPKLAFPYFDFLVQQQNVAAAQELWAHLSSHGEMSQYSQPGNSVVNPGFEKPLLNGGFDWRYRQIHTVSLRLDSDQSHSGRNSLGITFSGATADAGLMQMVAIEPDTTYEFSAYAKAHALEGAGGPRFQIQDAYSAQTLLLTDDLNDTFNWRSVEGAFHTSPETRLVALRVVRVPGNTLMRGKLWIDDLSIRKR